MMTLEQQRIAIAEWMGWKWELHKKESNWWLTNPDGKLIYGDCENNYPINQLPDFPNDLNAIHEAEKKLRLPNGCMPTEWYLQLRIASQDNEECATAQQRSEALCRTLWPERFEK